jgi:hypothetical protein
MTAFDFSAAEAQFDATTALENADAFLRTREEIRSLPEAPQHEPSVTDHEDYDPNRWNLH